MRNATNEDDFTIYFETGAKTTLSAADLGKMVTDGNSWLAMLQMLCGGPPALMVINTTNGQKGRIKVIRTETAVRGHKDASFDTL